MQWGMAHMVIFRRPDGKPGYHQADGVDDAVRFVEMLRNQEKVTDARIFRMEEVPIEIRAYYKVEVATEESEAPPMAAVPPNGPTCWPAWSSRHCRAPMWAPRRLIDQDPDLGAPMSNWSPGTNSLPC